MPLKVYFQHLRMTALEGIQLGSHFSDLSSRNYSYKLEEISGFLAPPISLPA